MRHILLMLLFVLSTSCVENIDCLYPIEIEGKYGYIDRKGKEIITPKDLYASRFNEGLALIITDTTKHLAKKYYSEWIDNDTLIFKYGYINKADRLIIDTILTYSTLVPVYKRNQSSTPFVPLCYDIEELLCYNGRIKFLNEGNWGEVGYMNNKGKVIIAPKYSGGAHFSDNLAYVWDKKESCWKYIDINGSITIDTGYSFASNFSEGYAIVSKTNWDDEYKDYFVIDKKGKIQSCMIKSRNIAIVSSFKNGKVLVMEYADEKSMYKYITTKGDILPESWYRFDFNNGEVINYYLDARPFSEGYAAVEYKKGRWCYIDASDDVPQRFGDYDSAKPFSEGLAPVRHSNKWGFVNSKFELVIPYKYDYCTLFHNGLAGFVIASSSLSIYGYINKSGEVIWQNELVNE